MLYYIAWLRPCGQKKESGFRIQDSGFRIQESGVRIQDSGFRSQESGEDSFVALVPLWQLVRKR
jgi:hypothetical protein